MHAVKFMISSNSMYCEPFSINKQSEIGISNHLTCLLYAYKDHETMAE